jgi:hypothetical protein
MSHRNYGIMGGRVSLSGISTDTSASRANTTPRDSILIPREFALPRGDALQTRRDIFLMLRVAALVFVAGLMIFTGGFFFLFFGG